MTFDTAPCDIGDGACVPMNNSAPLWSTPKFLLIVFVTSFVVVFVLNGVLNEMLSLGVPSGSFGAAIGVVVFVLMQRWSWFRTRIRKDAPKS